MPKCDYPHMLPVEWRGIVFDRHAIGAVHAPLPEAALWVAMRPSVFLAISTPLPKPRPSLSWLKARIAEGRAIAPAELRMLDGAAAPLALSHEGRHRMTAIRELLDDAPVPVRVSFKGYRCFEPPAEVVARFRAGARSQRGRSVVGGPLFDDSETDLGSLFLTGIPPPQDFVALDRPEVFEVVIRDPWRGRRCSTIRSKT